MRVEQSMRNSLFVIIADEDRPVSYTPEIVPAAIFSLRANILVNYGAELGATLEQLLMGTGVDLDRYRQNHVFPLLGWGSNSANV